MKIKNKSTFKPECLERFLKVAARAAKAKHGNLTATVTTAGRHATGLEESRRASFRKIGNHWAEIPKRYLVKLRVPFGNRAWTPYRLASRFFSVAIHEFTHVADEQRGERFGDYDRRWANRPHERRAIHAARETMENLTNEQGQIIIDMATELWKWRRKKEEER